MSVNSAVSQAGGDSFSAPSGSSRASTQPRNTLSGSGSHNWTSALSHELVIVLCPAGLFVVT